MRSVNFHTEHPASQDAYPGGSHAKVASAIHSHLLSKNPSKIVGLDGEFGSGKSSILNMLKEKLIASNPNSRVWFFDCEQNYQGSTKSNFIELFTNEMLQEVPHVSKAAEALKSSRDRALGRLFEYRKRTTSRVSAWAIALVASLFFAATSFRELFAISRSSHAAITGTSPEEIALANTIHDPFWWLISIHLVSLASPALILCFAKLRHINVKVGGQGWSLLSLFKGSSDDHIEEKIEIGKEVTPLDLKRTLLEQLGVLKDKRFYIVLDNIDRLPKENLRAVWSDLEIFIAVAGESANLTVIVPFCSTKVSEYLKADGDRRYDSKDFIAKKFPVVFRSPPVITSGWKDGFRQLWIHAFSNVGVSISDQCAQLLQRHSPMANGLVTPRLQKKFINDIATTSLVVGEEISLLAISGYLLLCKYSELSLSEVLRVDGLSGDYAQELEKTQKGLVESILDTKVLLGAILGESMETGWQIQFLQIHYLTSGNIAIAELLDTPLVDALRRKDEEALGSLTSMFGFLDAVKRLLVKRPTLEALLPTIAMAHQSIDGGWISSVLESINTARLDIFAESQAGSESFYDAVRYCISKGFDKKLLLEYGDHLRTRVITMLNTEFKETRRDSRCQLLKEYDNYLYALDLQFKPVVLDRAETVMHLLNDIDSLKVIDVELFSVEGSSLIEARLQLFSSSELSFDLVPLPASNVFPSVEWLYHKEKLNVGVKDGLTPTDISAIVRGVNSGEDIESAVIGLAFAATVTQTVINALANLVENNESLACKAVAAAIYIRNSDAEALGELEDLSSILGSSIFRALASATLKAPDLFGLLSDTKVGGKVGELVAGLIRERRIGGLPCNWIAANFSLLTTAVAEFEVSERDVATWLGPWDFQIEKECHDVLSVDATLIDVVLELGGSVLPKTYDRIMEEVISAEKTREQWLDVIQAGSVRHLAIVERVIKEHVNIPTIASLIDALVSALNSISTDSSGSAWGAKQYALIDALLNALDAQQRTFIGIRLRSLLFSESVDPQIFVVPLSRYGYLIPDIQPSNPQEVQRIILILAYLSRDPGGLSGLAEFFDARADQIAAFKYSPQLRGSMAEAVTKLFSITPALYKRFSETQGFKRLIQSLKKERG